MQITNLKDELYQTIHDCYALSLEDEEMIQENIKIFIEIMKSGFWGNCGGSINDRISGNSK